MLEFYAIESPLAQPRNAIVGQLISALVGVAIAKLFQLSDRFDDIQWIGGALACASATTLMALTKTVHPPAGATALLAVVSADLVRMGWFLIPVMMLGCALMLAVALLVNNIERRFPMYWWTPENPRQLKPLFLRRHSDEEMKGRSDDDDVAGEGGQGEEAVKSNANQDGQDENGHETRQQETDGTNGVIKRVARTHSHAGEVVIKSGQVIVPEHMFLTQEEQQLLETLCYRL